MTQIDSKIEMRCHTARGKSLGYIIIMCLSSPRFLARSGRIKSYKLLRALPVVV